MVDENERAEGSTKTNLRGNSVAVAAFVVVVVVVLMPVQGH